MTDHYARQRLVAVVVVVAAVVGAAVVAVVALVDVHEAVVDDRSAAPVPPLAATQTARERLTSRL